MPAIIIKTTREVTMLKFQTFYDNCPKLDHDIVLYFPNDKFFMSAVVVKEYAGMRKVMVQSPDDLIWIDFYDGMTFNDMLTNADLRIHEELFWAYTNELTAEISILRHTK